MLLDGARLVAVQKNRYSQGEKGLELDAGAFVAALEYSAGVVAEVVGKPTPAFFEAAARMLDRPAHELAMVGDDLRSDVGGAQRAGMHGVLVRTGKFRPGDERDPQVRPDAVLESVADLPRWLSNL
jgi:HAD superfamily hydrolase (TIGR01458 family)